MAGRILSFRHGRPVLGTHRFRGVAGYAYLAYFLTLPIALVAGPWIAVTVTGQSITAGIKTSATFVCGAYLLGLVLLLR